MTDLVNPGCLCGEKREAPTQIWSCPSLLTNGRDPEKQLCQVLCSLKCLALGGMNLGLKTQLVFLKTDGVKGKGWGRKGFQA